MSILLLKAEQKKAQRGEPDEGKRKRQHQKELSPLLLTFPVVHL